MRTRTPGGNQGVVRDMAQPAEADAAEERLDGSEHVQPGLAHSGQKQRLLLLATVQDRMQKLVLH